MRDSKKEQATDSGDLKKGQGKGVRDEGLGMEFEAGESVGFVVSDEE